MSDRWLNLAASLNLVFTSVGHQRDSPLCYPCLSRGPGFWYESFHLYLSGAGAALGRRVRIDPNATVRNNAAAMIGIIGSSLSMEVTSWLPTRGDSDRTAAASHWLQEYARFVGDTIPQLSAGAWDSDPRVAGMAANSLGRIEGQVRYILKRLLEDDHGLRAEPAVTLAIRQLRWAIGEDE